MLEVIKAKLEELKETAESLQAQIGGLFTAVEEASVPVAAAQPERTIAFGAKVSEDFKRSVLWIEDQLRLNADFLMACMAFETGGSFDPKIKNLAGSSGLGLIQFMAFTYANMIKTYPSLVKVASSHAALANLSAVEQLSFVYYYFKMFRSDYSAMTLEDVYMTILFPKAVGKPNDWEMPWKYGEIAYRQNSGLDLNKDKKITKAEASAGVRKMLALGEQLRG